MYTNRQRVFFFSLLLLLPFFLLLYLLLLFLLPLLRLWHDRRSYVIKFKFSFQQALCLFSLLLFFLLFFLAFVMRIYNIYVGMLLGWRCQSYWDRRLSIQCAHSGLLGISVTIYLGFVFYTSLFSITFWHRHHHHHCQHVSSCPLFLIVSLFFMNWAYKDFSLFAKPTHKMPHMRLCVCVCV